MIDLCIEVESTLGPILAAKTGPRRAQEAAKTAKTAPRGRQDGPRDGQNGPKRVQKNGAQTGCIAYRSVLAAKSPQEPPGTPPRGIFGEILINFWLIFGQFLVDFSINFLIKTHLKIDL